MTVASGVGEAMPAERMLAGDWASAWCQPLAEALGEEAGAALWIGEPHPGGGRWLWLVFAASELAGDAGTRGAALLAGAAPGADGERHLALPRAWQPAHGDQPAVLAVPAPGAWRADVLLPEADRAAPPELLCRLLLAELLAGIAAAHRRGWWHGLLTPRSVWLAGASPQRLVADCPRDPRAVLVGCGVLALSSVEAQAAAIARAPRRWLAPEVRRDARLGPAADLWAIGAVARALLAGAEGEMAPLLDALQASRPEDRPQSAAAAASAGELALAGLAAWQRFAPPPPRLVPSPAPLLGVSRRPPARTAAAPVAASPVAPARVTLRWPLPPSPATPRIAAGALGPVPFLGRPAAGGPTPALWLSVAPTAVAGILSVLLALALLLAMP